MDWGRESLRVVWLTGPDFVSQAAIQIFGKNVVAEVLWSSHFVFDSKPL